MRIALAAAGAAVGALAVLAPAAGAASPPTTIKVVSVSVRLDENDRPPKGASKGDTVVFHDNLLNAARQFGKAKGAQVGTDSGTLTFLGPSSARFDGSATLPGGTLILRGQVRASAGGGMTIPVAGGTGRYKGAHGMLIVGPGDKRSLNTYRLTYPIGPVA